MSRRPETYVRAGMSDDGPNPPLPLRWVPSGKALSLLRVRRKVMPFVGAGMSGAAKLPDGRRLAEHLGALPWAAGIQLSNPASCVDVASDIVAAGGRREVTARRERLNREVAKFHELSRWADFRLTEAQRGLVHVPSKWIVTTNYDLALERAAFEEHVDHESFTNRDLTHLRQVMLDEAQAPSEGRPLRIVHLHGSADDHTSIVLDSSSYQEHAQRQAVGHFLVTALGLHSACFIGFGFDEPYLQVLLESFESSSPRHVLLVDEDAASLIRSRGSVTPAKHGIETSAFPAGAWEVLDDVCRWIGSPTVTPTPSIRFADTTDEDYTPNRIVPFEESTSELSAKFQMALGRIEPDTERDLAMKHRTVVRGAPGAGKTQLLRRVGYLAPSPETPVLVRLGRLSVDADRLSSPEGREVELLRWSREGERFGEVAVIDDVALQTKPFHFLVDGLDEVASDSQLLVAEVLSDVAAEHPQHRFTIGSRPIAALSAFDDGWEQLRVAPDESWRDAYLARHDLTWRQLIEEAPSLQDMSDLLELPFFLASVVKLRGAGRLTSLSTPFNLVQALIDHALASPDLEPIAAAVRPWLQRAAISMQLSPSMVVPREDLERIPVLPAPVSATPQQSLDLLVNRSLLEAEGVSYGFFHRLIAETLVTEALLAVDPSTEVLDFIAPQLADDVGSGLREAWLVPVTFLLPVSRRWRDALRPRDELAVARGVPPVAATPEAERREAARAIWGRYSDWEIWIHDRRRNSMLHDGKALGKLLASGGLEDVAQEVVAATTSLSRQTRSNALEVLSYARHPDVSALLRHTLTTDEDSVVRRQAAIAATRLGDRALYPAVRARALDPEDDAEEQDTMLALGRLVPPDEALGLAIQLAEAGRTFTSPVERAVEAASGPRGLLRALRAQTQKRETYSAKRRLPALIREVDLNDAAVVHEIGFVVAAAEIRDDFALNVAYSNPAAFLSGLLEAIETRAARYWTAALPFVEAIPTELMSRQRAPEELIRSGERRDSVDQRASGPAAAAEWEPFDGAADELAAKSLAELLSQGDAGADVELLGRAQELASEIDELSAGQRSELAKKVRAWWPADGVASEITVVRPNSYRVGSYAIAVLFFGPELDLSLSGQEWIDVATCRFISGPQREWLRRQWSGEALEEVLGRTEPDLASWSELLSSIPEPMPPEVVRVVAKRITRFEAQDHEVYSVIGPLQTAGALDVLNAFSAQDETFARLSRRARATLGDEVAQKALLEAVLDQFAAGEDVDDELAWLHGVRSDALLPLLFECLVASYRHKPVTRGWNTSMTSIHAAIRNVGGAEAVRAYDRLLASDPPAWAGVQFIRDHRNALVNDLLDAAASEAEAGFRAALSLA